MLYLEDPEIICLNETKIQNKDIEPLGFKELFSKEYYQYWHCSQPPAKLGDYAFLSLYIYIYINIYIYRLLWNSNYDQNKAFKSDI